MKTRLGQGEGGGDGRLREKHLFSDCGILEVVLLETTRDGTLVFLNSMLQKTHS